MIKRFAYIVLLLLFASRLSSAGTIKSHRYSLVFSNDDDLHHTAMPFDTLTTKRTKQQQEEEKKAEQDQNAVLHLSRDQENLF